MNLDEFLKSLKALNSKVDEYNKKAEKQEWLRNNAKSELETLITNYNEKYNKDLTLEDADGIVKEFNNVLRDKVEKFKKLERALQFAEQGEFGKASELVEVKLQEAETISVETAVLDLYEIEKDVELALDNYEYKSDRFFGDDLNAVNTGEETMNWSDVTEDSSDVQEVSSSSEPSINRVLDDVVEDTENDHESNENAIDFSSLTIGVNNNSDDSNDEIEGLDAFDFGFDGVSIPNEVEHKVEDSSNDIIEGLDDLDLSLDNI